MDSVASFFFWVVGVMVMLAGPGAGFCCPLCLENIRYNKKLNSIKPKRPSSDLSVVLDVFLSSFQCEMNGTSQVRGVYIV